MCTASVRCGINGRLLLPRPLTFLSMPHMKTLSCTAALRVVLLGVTVLFAGGNVSAQSVGLYLSPPGEQNTTRAGATVEPFSGPVGAIAATGNFAVGAWSGATGVSLQAANLVGGAGETGTYLDVNAGGGVSITLTGNRKYVGFWWSAGDYDNVIEFYDDSNALLASYTTPALTTLLSGGGNITAFNGSQYPKSAYWDNPNPPAGRNTSEPYGYINVVLEDTTLNFRRIVIRQTGGWHFELDNLAVADAPVVSDTWVKFGTTSVAAGQPSAVDDTGATPANTPLNASVAANDFTLPGSSYSVTASPTNGTLTLNTATGGYTYTPNAGYSGTDTFTYSVCLPAPNAALCDSAVATITVGPQAIPVAAAVSIAGTPSVGQLLTGSYSYSDVNADLEGISGFRWVRSATNSVAGGTNVGNASSYTTVAADGGSFLFYCVTPVAVTGLSPGLEVCGPAVQVAAAGVASPVGIPTLSQWGLILLSALMGLSMVLFSRTRR